MSYVEINVGELEFYEQLGRGSNGSVYRGKWKDKIVAVKQLHEIKTTEVNNKQLIIVIMPL